MRLGLSAETLRLGEAVSQTATSAQLALRQPLMPSLTALLSASTDTRTMSTGGRLLLEARRSEAVAGGLEASDSLSALGRLRLSALAGWDGGIGGEGRLTLEGQWHRLEVAAWRVRGRESRVLFPADSLRDVGVSGLVDGFRVRAAADVSIGRLRLLAAGAAERQTLHSDDADRQRDGAFLHTSPEGEGRAYDVSVSAHVAEWGMAGALRSRTLDMESSFYRSGLAAGRVFYATFDLTRWTVGLERRLSGSRWSATVGRERVLGDLSTRVETWPFVDLWSTLSAQAYRLRGRVDARSSWLEAGRTSSQPGGWSSTLQISRYEVSSDRESWYVTSFGFGRTGQEATRSGVESAVMLSGEVGRAVRMGATAAEVTLEAAVPVHARTLGPGAPEEDTRIGGFVGVVVRWAW